MAGVWYCTREQIKRASNVHAAAYADDQIDRAIEAASRSVEDQLHRRFYPTVDTRYFTATNPNRLWFDEHEVLSITTVTSDGAALVEGTDFHLEPSAGGPPYDRLDIDVDSGATLSLDQRAVVVAGVFGGHNTETQYAQTSEEMDTADNTLTFSTAGTVGVGDVFRVDSERMIATARSMVDTTDDITGNLAAQHNDDQVGVADGSAFEAGETILVDSERMLIVDITGNTLAVRRGWEGTTLAAHTSGADVYSPRRFTVARGQLGTTAATHSTATDIYRLVRPPLVESLCVAETMVLLEQERAAYARTVGSGESERETAGRGLRAFRRDARDAHGRIPAPEGAAV